MKDDEFKEGYCYYNNHDRNPSYNIKDSEQSGKLNWWINELDSLGIKKSGNNNQRNSIEESSTSQQLEDLTDYVKQTFIRDYKVCYNE